MPCLTRTIIAGRLRTACRTLLLVGVALMAAGCGGHPFFPIECCYNENYSAVTDDGVELLLLRHNPPEVDPDTVPLVMCHGLATNAFVFDLRPDVSLANYLSQRGIDVWTLSLAGRKGSQSRPGPTDLDSFARYDLPAAIERVKRETGAPRVAVLGWSMGSMITIAHLERSGGDDIAGFVSVAGPVVMDEPYHPTIAFARDHPALIKAWMATANLKGMAAVVQFFPGLSKNGGLMFNPDNVDDKVVSSLFAHAVDNVTWATFDQLHRFLERGRFVSRDGSVDYAARLGEIRTPTLVIGGSLDQICRPSASRYLYRNLGSSKKTLKIMGRAEGALADYGHTDILLGRASEEDVYPEIHRWLVDHARPVRRMADAR